MNTKTQQLFKKNLQTIPAIKSPKDLGYILIQYCQDILTLFNIDRCGILIPNSCFFFESIFVRATKENGNIENNVFIPTPSMPWKWQNPTQNALTDNGIIIFPDISPAHPYRSPVESLFKCRVLALVISPLFLNDEIIGYLILVNEKKPHTFTDKEISLLDEIAHHTIKIIKPAIKMGEEEQRDRIIEAIKGYKESVAEGREKEPGIIVNFLRIAHLHILRVMLINKDPQKGTKWYHAEVNGAFQVETIETGTLADDTFDFFINEINILDPDYLDIPITIENNVVGKLALKCLKTEYHNAMQENYIRLLLEIAPYLAELMYL
jgi:transcriptional regulator with GAF, ATPase, and Fis domain